MMEENKKTSSKTSTSTKKSTTSSTKGAKKNTSSTSKKSTATTKRKTSSNSKKTSTKIESVIAKQVKNEAANKISNTTGISNKNAKKVVNKAEKTYKKNHPVTVLLIVIFFVIGAIGAFITCNIIQKDDTFELVGESKVTLNVGGEYVEPSLNEAIRCISFSSNAIDSVSINDEETTYTNDSAQTEGIYYIVYQSSNFKYKNIKRIRTIVVNTVSSGDDDVSGD